MPLAFHSSFVVDRDSNCASSSSGSGYSCFDDKRARGGGYSRISLPDQKACQPQDPIRSPIDVDSRL
ncbi:hypothetical protein CLAIMM_13609 [Cladophialophora immunda]|nr:hypothetical protein CLAIMM_13609 [Cladophialophora immunda]